jgi:hypothetical protein
MVWDRYLPYGAALGVTHTASAVLDLGMGDRRLVWSSYGGHWRRVRVRYPRLWSRYGRTVPSLLLPALLSVLVGALLVRYRELPVELDLAVDDLVSRLALVFGALLLVRGGYRAVRTLVDLATIRTITGEVLWRDAWRSKSQGKNRPSALRRPRNPPTHWLDYLAVDDGNAAARTTAWGLPRALAGASCQHGDTVTIRVRRWSRRVIALTLVERGRAARLVDAPAPAEDNAGSGMLAAALGRPGGGTAEPVLTAEEVGQALGMPVRPPERMPAPGTATFTFATADRGRQVLLVQCVGGAIGRWAWQSQRKRGTPLPGIGDGAYQTGDRAAARVGETTLALTLLRDAKGRHHHLAWLLQQAVGRLAPPGARSEADGLAPRSS